MRQMKLCLFLSSLAIFINCQKDPINPNFIGLNGGSVCSPDLVASISIPAGALKTDTEISIEGTTIHPSGNIGNVYEFGPDGTQFNKPVTITYKFIDEDLKGLKSDLRMAYVENEDWKIITSTVDEKNNTVSGVTNHFSIFGRSCCPPVL